MGEIEQCMEQDISNICNQENCTYMKVCADNSIIFTIYAPWNDDLRLIVISEIGSEKLDSEEIFEEIISLLHCYSMKLYSNRKSQKIKSVLEEKEDEE